MQKSKLRFLLLIIVFISGGLLNSQASAALFDRAKYFNKEQLPIEERVPGGIALLPFIYTEKNIPKVTFLDHRVLVQQTGKKEWIAVIGLPLKLNTGKHAALLESSKGSIELPFEVGQKEYEAQYITLKDNKKVSPSQDSLVRISKETRIMKDAFASWSERAPTSLTAALPAKGPLSSRFGLKRFFNNQPRNPHSGLDIAADHGSEVIAPLAGLVVVIGDYFFNGNTILIDHGQGMVSMYCHLDSIKVTEGQEIKAGTPIGTVGSTGRATGPHLHWSMNLNNTRVNPLLFVPENTQQN
jgi:murein DD-endopeptidase MepM/ murein hydrolase activator NlpD